MSTPLKVRVYPRTCLLSLSVSTTFCVRSYAEEVMIPASMSPSPTWARYPPATRNLFARASFQVFVALEKKANSETSRNATYSTPRAPRRTPAPAATTARAPAIPNRFAKSLEVPFQCR